MDVNLVLFKKSGRSKAFPLPSSLTVIGRRQDCDLCIPLQIVSRRHCELNLDSGRLSVRDLESRNGTFINGDRVETETVVNPGDQIQIGPLNFMAQIDGKPKKATSPPSEGMEQTSMPEKQFVDHSENLSDMEEFDLPGDHHSTEMLDISDELLGDG